MYAGAIGVQGLRTHLDPWSDRGCQELSVLEAEGSLTGDKWEKCPTVTSPEAPCGIDCLRRGHFKDLKGYQWLLGVATVNTEKIKQLSTPPGLLEHPFLVGLLQGEEQQLPIATETVHWQQYRTNRDSLAPIHELIHQLESQGVISRTHPLIVPNGQYESLTEKGDKQ